MITQRFRESVSANSTVEVSLGALRSIPHPGGRVTLYAVAATDGAIRCTLALGSETLVSRGFLSVPTSAGRVEIPQDMMAQGIGVGGDPVVLQLENVTGAAVVAHGLITLE
jgi:hypothetical protein